MKIYAFGNPIFTNSKSSVAKCRARFTSWERFWKLRIWFFFLISCLFFDRVEYLWLQLFSNFFNCTVCHEIECTLRLNPFSSRIRPTTLKYTRLIFAMFSSWLFSKLGAYFLGKVQLFWEGHNILWNLYSRFVLCSNSGNFATFCGVLRMFELYFHYIG